LSDQSFLHKANTIK